MFIVINPTWRCNLASEIGKCPYCPNLVSDNGHRVEFYWGLGENKVGFEATARQWLDFLPRLGSGIVDICGGEPLCWDGLQEFIEGLPKGFEWYITSNCLQPEIIKKLDLSRCRMWTASFHPYAMGKGDYGNRFFRSLRVLVKRHLPVVVSIMAYPENIHWLPFWAEAFAGWAFTVNVQPYEDPRYDWREHPDKLEGLMAVKQYENELKLPYWDSEPSSKMCAAGKDYLMTAPDGTVYRCNMALITGAKPLGSIFDSGDFILKEAALCEIPCSSSCDRERREGGKDLA